MVRFCQGKKSFILWANRMKGLFIMGLTKERERLLISRIQKDDDEQALKELYYSCLPVIGGTIKQRPAASGPVPSTNGVCT